MPTVNIYHKQSLLETRGFQGQFYILKPFHNSKDLVWETGEEQRQTPRGGATIVIWLQRIRDGHRLSFVPPDWHLQVNNMECERGLYLDLVIKWHKVNLSYDEFSFEFLFDQQEYEDESLPKPAARQLPE